MWPALEPYGDVTQHGFLGLSTLGYSTFALLWVLQAAVFWTGMDTIRKFIDFCGPAVYVVMFILCFYLLSKANWNVSLNLSSEQLSGRRVISTMFAATALVVSYFSGPMLNFGDFSRYGKYVQGGQARQLLGPAGQLHDVLGADRAHRSGDAPGLRRARSPTRSRPSARSTTPSRSCWQR